MKAKIIVSFLALYLAIGNAAILPQTAAKYLEGPSTRTKIIGPDGSFIDAYAPGGKILLDGHAGPVLQEAPVVLAQPAQFFIPAAQEERLILHPDTHQRVELREPVPVTEDNSNETAGTTELYPTTERIDLSGTYVPDKLEKRFDDGSYRPEHH
ncbi:hypothetical protein ABEB36_002902 [Hypothenemus hampei]|uniref:Uncharacterized protein n=1 Tax=Hypothenemus hampei TaxID=57062 RepID=A0ABD1F7D5_HYPHA